MIKKLLLTILLLTGPTAAFLTPLAVPVHSPRLAPLRAGNRQKDGVAMTPVTCLERDYRELKEKLRHDLLQLKHKQSQVAKEEEELLEETIHVTEFERFGQEMDVKSKQEELQRAHAAVEAARANKKRAYDNMEKALDQAVILKTHMDSDESALAVVNLIEQASKDLKESLAAVQMNQEKEQAALRLETGAEVLLEFLAEQEAHLKDVASSLDPLTLEEWSTEEATEHHLALLNASSTEWEYQKLRHRLQTDLLDLEHQKEQVLQEERLLASKAAELLRLKEAEEVRHATEAFAAMQQANKVLQEAVARKEKAYDAALWALDEVVGVKDDIDKTDRRALELWFLEGQDEKYLDAAEQAVKKAKETQEKATRREVQAEDMLLRLTQKEKMLQELRQPGNEKNLQFWIQNELSRDQSIVRGLRKKLPPMASNPIGIFYGTS